MNDLEDSIKNYKEALLFRPKDYERFIGYLSSITDEKALFSRLTYWWTFRGSADDQNYRFNALKDRANELGLWKGFDLKVDRWKKDVAAEIDEIGMEAFKTAAGEDFTTWYNSLADSKPTKPSALKVISAKELSEMDLPPLQYIVDGLIPMGLGLLVAKPKIGKSWMILDLCLSVAAGEPFLGYQTNQHGTLYLALEDGLVSAKDRILKVTNGKPVPPAARINFEASRLDEGLLDELGALLDENPDIKLICIDTLSMVKPMERAYDNAYSADYRFMGQLKKFADDRGICIILVHHTSKRRTDDSFDAINGSTGLMGASDFSMILSKPDRSENEATLSITGRNIRQQEKIVRFDETQFRWVMQGSAAEIAEQRRVAECEDNPIVRTLDNLLLSGDGTWKGNAHALMEQVERCTGETPNLSGQALGKYLDSITDLLDERHAITYTSQPKGTGGKVYRFQMHRTDNTADLPKTKQISLPLENR